MKEVPREKGASRKMGGIYQSQELTSLQEDVALPLKEFTHFLTETELIPEEGLYLVEGKIRKSILGKPGEWFGISREVTPDEARKVLDRVAKGSLAAFNEVSGMLRSEGVKLTDLLIKRERGEEQYAQRGRNKYESLLESRRCYDRKKEEQQKLLAQRDELSDRVFEEDHNDRDLPEVRKIYKSIERRLSAIPGDCQELLHEQSAREAEVAYIEDALHQFHIEENAIVALRNGTFFLADALQTIGIHARMQHETYSCVYDVVSSLVDVSQKTTGSAFGNALIQQTSDLLKKVKAPSLPYDAPLIQEAREKKG